MNRYILRVLQIIIGCTVYVIGINFFLVPAGIFTTGLMGLAQEISQTINLLFNLDLNYSDSIFTTIQILAYWSLNIPIIIFGFVKIHVKFSFKTLIISSLLIPLLIKILVIDQNLIVDLNGEITLASQLLSLLTGSVLIGIGLGLILRNEASSGGTDIIAIYLSLFKGKSFGRYNLLINLLVVVWAVLLTADITRGVMILLSLYIQSQVVDIMYNFNSKSTMMIFTTKPQEVGKYILDEGRTYTSLDGVKGYSNEEIKVLITVINDEEKDNFMYDLLKIDENIFIDVFSSGVIGNFKNKYLSNKKY